jgi:FkbM family methyltransferase
MTNQSTSLTKAYLRRVVDMVLKLQGTSLPSHFNLNHRLSYLLSGLEPSVVRVSADILRPGDIAVDIGANVGFLTRQFARMVGRKGRVFSFEPDPDVFEHLQFNTQRFAQVSLAQTAMSDSCGTSTLYLHPMSAMSNSLVNVWEDARPLTVHTLTFDAWVTDANPGKLRLIKIDVEGAEPLVLRGMRMTLASPQKPHVILEFCPKNLRGREAEEEIFGILSGNGYKVQCIDSRGGLRRVQCPSDVYASLNQDGYVNLLARVVGS